MTKGVLTFTANLKWLDVLLSRAPQEPTDHLCHDNQDQQLQLYMYRTQTKTILKHKEMAQNEMKLKAQAKLK